MIQVLQNGRIIINDEQSHFLIQEFVPKRVYEFFGNNSIWCLDPMIIKLAEFTRLYFNKSMTINNWNTGGKFQYRCFRPDVYYYEKQTDGSYKDVKKGKYSQHRYGRAIDYNISGVTPDDIRSEILKNQDMWLDAGLTTIEDGAYAPTWMHGDIRYTGMDKILIVKP